MRRVIRELIDAVIIGVCLTAAAREWWERHETKRLMASLSPAEREQLFTFIGEFHHG